jgi:VWFA-related protein
MRILAATAVFLMTAAGVAQEPFRVTTRLVEVAVVVRGKDGPVARLNKNNFELFDNGKRREIAAFHSFQSADRLPAAVLPLNTFTNKLNRATESPVTATVLLFDQLNTAFSDQASARRQVVNLLESMDGKADAGNPVAVYALGNSLRIVHDFANDPSQLADALAATKGQKTKLFENSQNDPSARAVGSSIAAVPGQALSAPLNAATLGGPVATVDRILEPMQSYSMDRRVAMTFAAMKIIADRMAGVPGRKNLIWVSGAFPLSITLDRTSLAGGLARSNTYTNQMRDAAAAFDRANIAIYPVDSRGLQVGGSVGALQAALCNQAIDGVCALRATSDMSGGREVDSMKLLADWTGGRAFYNSNNLSDAVKQAMQDAEVSYTLGFYVEEKELDSTYHDIRVKVTRKGTETRHRKGYFATPIPAAQSESAISQLRDVVRAPADATGIGLTATLSPNPNVAQGSILVLGIDVQNLRLEKRNGRWVGGTNLALVQQTEEGLVLDSMEQSIDIAATDAERDRLLAGGLAVTFGIVAAPGLSQIRIALMDQGNGNTGSLRITPQPGTGSGVEKEGRP